MKEGSGKTITSKPGVEDTPEKYAFMQLVGAMNFHVGIPDGLILLNTVRLGSQIVSGVGILGPGRFSGRKVFVLYHFNKKGKGPKKKK